MALQLGQSTCVQVMDQYNQVSITKKISNYIFKFDDKIGEGNFSKVYKGHHQITSEIVAIKIVQLSSVKSPKLQELLFSEIEVIQSLNHPNILKCYEVLKSDNNCYIITQFCNGGDLQSELKKYKAFSEKSAASYIRDIYKGLKYLGDRGIVHRDLKIANIFLHNGVAKIADFGFAKYTNNQNFKDMDIGSPLYMSPQGMLNHIYGMKTDIWSFGVIIFQLLHGKTPFCHCKTQQELKSCVVQPLPEHIFRPDISYDIKNVIMNCMNVNSDHRPDAQILSQDIFLNRFLSLDNKHQPINNSMNRNSQPLGSFNRSTNNAPYNMGQVRPQYQNHNQHQHQQALYVPNKVNSSSKSQKSFSFKNDIQNNVRVKQGTLSSFGNEYNNRLTDVHQSQNYHQNQQLVVPQQLQKYNSQPAQYSVFTSPNRPISNHNSNKQDIHHQIHTDPRQKNFHVEQNLNQNNGKQTISQKSAILYYPQTRKSYQPLNRQHKIEGYSSTQNFFLRNSGNTPATNNNGNVPVRTPQQLFVGERYMNVKQDHIKMNQQPNQHNNKNISKNINNNRDREYNDNNSQSMSNSSWFEKDVTVKKKFPKILSHQNVNQLHVSFQPHQQTKNGQHLEKSSHSNNSQSFNYNSSNMLHSGSVNRVQTQKCQSPNKKFGQMIKGDMYRDDHVKSTIKIPREQEDRAKSKSQISIQAPSLSSKSVFQTIQKREKQEKNSSKVIQEKQKQKFKLKSTNSLGIQEQQKPNKNASIIKTVIQFRQAVGLLHYCRLIYRFLTTYRKVKANIPPNCQKLFKCVIQPQQEQIFSRFLLTTLKQLVEKITQKQVIYDGQTYKKKQIKEQKLKQVTEEYYRKYYADINKLAFNHKSSKQISPINDASTSLAFFKQFIEDFHDNLDSKRVQNEGYKAKNILVKDESSNKSLKIFEREYINLCYYSIRILEADEVLSKSVNSGNYKQIADLVIENWLAKENYSEEIYLKLKEQHEKFRKSVAFKSSGTNETDCNKSNEAD